MFVVITNEGTEVSTFDLDFALCSAVRLVTLGAEHAQVYDYDPQKLFFDVERDTKVDDADPFYPAIVHRRSLL